VNGPEFLDRAAGLVNRRRREYGAPADLFEHVARHWSLTLLTFAGETRPMAAIASKSSPLADDRLVGVAAIAKFRNEPRRRTQYLIDTGRLPHGREGRVIVASKRVLLAHWAKLTGGEQ
jgi:hypothetical protein